MEADFNIVVLGGRLAAVPEVRELEEGGRLVRYLVTTKVTTPHKRVDVVPVVLWDPPASLIGDEPPPGQRVFVAGTVQRRFWQAEGVRRSRIEIVARQVCLRDEPDEAPDADAAGEAVDGSGGDHGG